VGEVEMQMGDCNREITRKTADRFSQQGRLPYCLKYMYSQ